MDDAGKDSLQLHMLKQIISVRSGLQRLPVTMNKILILYHGLSPVLMVPVLTFGSPSQTTLAFLVFLKLANLIASISRWPGMYFLQVFSWLLLFYSDLPCHLLRQVFSSCQHFAIYLPPNCFHVLLHLHCTHSHLTLFHHLLSYFWSPPLKCKLSEGRDCIF